MTPSGSSVKIWWDASIGAYRLTSGYNKSLLETFKLLVPASQRSYDPETKIWTFTEQTLPMVEKVLTMVGLKATIVSRQQAEAASASGSNTSASAHSSQATLDTVILAFVKAMPYESMQKAYRDAAMRCHPDRGGSMDKMAQLNSTWQRLEKELWNQ
jgi:hypothetical protein